MIIVALGIALLLWALYTEGGSIVSAGTGVVNVATYARNAGWSGIDLITAVAIALAESGGNPSAKGDFGNPVAGQYNAFGLWQINTGENPQFLGDDLLDPQVNANDAFALYQQAGNSFSPWSTFKNGAYKAQVNAATQLFMVG